MASEPKKTLYHSELTRSEWVTAIITSDLIPSKYKKGTFCVMMEIDGMERTYTCENPACASALEGLKGKSVTFSATGSRDDAMIEVDEQSITDAEPSAPARPARRTAPAASSPRQAATARPAPRSARPAPPEQEQHPDYPPETPPEPETPADTRTPEQIRHDSYVNAVGKARVHLARSANKMSMCIDAAIHVLTEAETRHAELFAKLPEGQNRLATPDLIERVAVSFAIGFGDERFNDILPAGPLTNYTRSK